MRCCCLFSKFRSCEYRMAEKGNMFLLITNRSVIHNVVITTRESTTCALKWEDIYKVYHRHNTNMRTWTESILSILLDNYSGGVLGSAVSSLNLSFKNSFVNVSFALSKMVFMSEID